MFSHCVDAGHQGHVQATAATLLVCVGCVVVCVGEGVLTHSGSAQFAAQLQVSLGPSVSSQFYVVAL